MAAFSLDTDAEASGWQTVHRPTVLRTYGTWQGSAQLECRGVNDGTNISKVGSPIAHDDAELSKLIDHPVGISLQYRVVFTRTSGTLEGAIGG
ncbi:MAG: hypothetical protein B7Z37_24025 [Verrucomicrobia bacterium 12-59-8]|nr:MAG: hypothetical protein B7Z37_24025 [Verrucomicrobia bacterium 12-59-8]